MPSRNKARKSKRTKPKSTSARKKTTKNKRTAKSKASSKSIARRTAPKKAASKTRRPRKRSASVSAERELRQDIRSRNLGIAPEQRSEDLQGLSRSAQADSESVDELVDEGNIFEAGAVAGVEAADDADEREVRTHELPEDDVPGEYLDED